MYICLMSKILMLCYVMLCYVMLCYVMLCYVMLCYVMLCYVLIDTVNSRYLKVEVHPEVLISESKFSCHRKIPRDISCLRLKDLKRRW